MQTQKIFTIFSTKS